MSYDINIISYDLIRTNKSKNIDDIDELFLDWKEIDDNRIKLMENYFHWDDDFINDLVKLVQIGVEGEIVIMGEVGEYIKYVLTDNEVKEFDGIIVYGTRPHDRFTEVK